MPGASRPGPEILVDHCGAGGDGKAYVVGIVSSILPPGLDLQETGRGFAAFDIGPFYDYFLQLIRGNDHYIVA